MTNATRFDLARPCGTCPFRVDGKPVLLGAERREEIAAAIESDATFICHERMEYVDGEDDVSGGPQCAGATLTAHPPQLMRIYDRFRDGLEHDVVYPEETDAIPWVDAWDWAENMEGWDA